MRIISSGTLAVKQILKNVRDTALDASVFAEATADKTMDKQDKFRILKILLLCGFPPQVGIVPAFKNPPDILRAVGRLVYEVPSGIEERARGSHISVVLSGGQW